MSGDPQERGGAADRAAVLAAVAVTLAFIAWIAAVQSGQGHAHRMTTPLGANKLACFPSSWTRTNTYVTAIPSSNGSALIFALWLPG
jgi:hypothetical protein